MAGMAEERDTSLVATKCEKARKLLSAWEGERRERRRRRGEEEEDEEVAACDDGFAYAEFSTRPAQEHERVCAIDGAFSHAECDAVLSAVRSAVTRRGGWDKDRHGRYPTTDLPLAQVPECEALVRSAVFRRVLCPLTPLYLPAGFLPEHLELTDCFYVKCTRGFPTRHLDCCDRLLGSRLDCCVHTSLSRLGGTRAAERAPPPHGRLDIQLQCASQRPERFRWRR